MLPLWNSEYEDVIRDSSRYISWSAKRGGQFILPKKKIELYVDW